jgi:methionyl-tRNA formyltransferase
VRAVVFAYHNVGDRCLRVLHARGVDVALVVTHRDRPDENIWFRRVADTAAELNLSFIYGEDPTDPALAEAVRAAKPDVIFSFYYRSMIPADLLAVAPQGAFNMHGSLLPKYRGRVPVNWAVLRGEDRNRRHAARDGSQARRRLYRRPDVGANPAGRHGRRGLREGHRRRRANAVARCPP